MRVRRATDRRGFSIPSFRTLPTLFLCILIVTAASGVALAGEFYSWTDSSGMMVLTDNPGRIPPATSRGPVAVYQFKDSPPPSPQDRAVRMARAAASMDMYAEDILPEPDPMPSPHWSAQRVEPIDPAELGISEVLLDVPAEPVKPQYVWVPFVVPVYLGAGAVSGFWCHRDATSPILAFKQFLAQNPGMVGIVQNVTAVMTRPQRHGDMVYHPALSTLPPTSGNPVYDQIMREQQAMLQRIYSRPAASMPALRSSFPQGSRIGHSRSGLRR